MPPQATTDPPPIKADDWFSPARFALLLALLIFATFPQVLLGLQTFVVRDYGFFAHPLAHFQREAFWRGELPLWNPLNNCGVPFLAQWNTMPLYPPALIYLLAPLTWSLSFFCLTHQWLAGLGAYFLARRWTGNNFAAAFAGVAFAFNGLTLNLLMWPSHIATFAWMPWVILLGERAWREGGRMIYLAALVGAMQMLAGGPETILFTWLLLTALWVVELARPRRLQGEQGALAGFEAGTTRGQIALRFPIVVLLVTALTVVQLLPFLDLAAHSQRDAGYADSRWAMPLRGWANFLVPMAFGRVWNMGVFFQHGQAWTSSYYLGMAATLLGALAIWRARERRVWLLALATGVAWLLAFGDNLPPVRWLRQAVPQLSLMTYPVKFVLLIAFLVPQLAAFAVARIWKSAGRGPGPESGPSSGDPSSVFRSPAFVSIAAIGGVMFFLIGVILVWAWRMPMANDDPTATLINGAIRAGFLLASVGLLLVLGRSQSALRFAPVALLLVAWLDVYTHAPTQNPTVANWIYEPRLARTKLNQQPQPAAGESRVMVSPAAELRFTQLTTRNPADNFIVKRLGYFANCNLLDNVPKVNGFFSLYPREIGELMSALYGSTNLHPTGLHDFMGVSQITARENFVEWQARTNFLPFITAGQQPAFMDETNTLYGMVRPDFDGRSVVFLPPAARAYVTATNRANVRLAGWRFGAERIECEVEAESAALVVLAQTFYHRWRAYVDDRPVPLLRANFAFQAVEVPAGKHRVRLAYEDGPFKLGALVSVAALVVCSAGVWRGRRRAGLL